jgi:hypothetical protein
MDELALLRGVRFLLVRRTVRGVAMLLSNADLSAVLGRVQMTMDWQRRILIYKSVAAYSFV